MKNILVTGAGGYIGTVLVRYLLEKGYLVTAFDRFYFGKEKLPTHKNLILKLEDCRNIRESDFSNIDCVIDLVAISNDPSGEVFADATMDINYLARAKTAELAKKAGVKRYILPSSCSIYGFQNNVANEESVTNPLTNYARANELAEIACLAQADENFISVVMRQATVFGFSHRMRFDLAVNAMVLNSLTEHKLMLMRDGEQYRPFLHINDTVEFMELLLRCDANLINGQIFNVGSDANTYKIKNIANLIVKKVSERVGKNVVIEWYGDADNRSYTVDFSKAQKVLNWTANYSVENGIDELIRLFEIGQLKKSPDTMTLDWYKELTKWHQILTDIGSFDGILDMKSVKN